jgi:hypothetical protein
VCKSWQQPHKSNHGYLDSPFPMDSPASGPEPAERVCIICLDSDPPPIQSGCACRSDTGLAHVECPIESAVSQQEHRGNSVWRECQTCERRFTGAMQKGLAEAWWSRLCDEAVESEERLLAAGNLAECRRCNGQYAEAERINREVFAACRRVLGDGHPRAKMPCLARSLKLADTLESAGNLANALRDQGKSGEAEQIERELLGVRRGVLGEEHPDTLEAAGHLASSLLDQGSLREVCGGGADRAGGA